MQREAFRKLSESFPSRHLNMRTVWKGLGSSPDMGRLENSLGKVREEKILYGKSLGRIPFHSRCA